MSAIETCPQCGATLDADSPQGLCPACLLRQAMNSQATLPVDSRAGESGAAFTPPTPADLAQYFPQLEILELIGRGGMGAVYKARQRALDRIVALKVLPPAVSCDPSFEERFTREARALARVNHPNIVNVYEFGQSPAGLYYFVMEYVDGVNLRQMIRAQQLKPGEALAIIPQICDALQYAHDEGIVHRDIKPENILIDRKGRVKIADFGLAKILNPRPADYTLTSPQMVMGTPHYMAPEQLEKPATVDHRADIYSLGVVFYEMLTGELPLGRFAPPSHKITLDIRLDEVVLKTLAKEPARRYQHASDVRTEVETIAREGITKAKTERPAAPATRLDEDVRRQVRGPAIGLIIAAIINWVALFVTIPLLMWWQARLGRGAPAGAMLALVGVLIAATTFILIGAMKMMRLESLAWARAASILAMIVGPGYIVGWPVGIWALLTLVRPDVKAAFGHSSPKRTGARAGYTLAPPRLSRTSIVGALFAPLMLLVLPSTYMVRSTDPQRPATVVAEQIGEGNATEEIADAAPGVGDHRQGEPPDGREMILMQQDPPRLAIWAIIAIFATIAISLASPFVTTILGVVAIGQIRRSEGRIYGMPLAIADAMLYPLIVLNVLVGVFWYNVLPRGTASQVTALTILTCVIVDILLVRWCWRAATSK